MNIIERRLSQKRKKDRINTLENKLNKNGFFTKDNGLDIVDSLMIDIAKLGLPFHRHNKGSKVYISSAKKLSRLYKKHRSEVLEVFKLGQEYFNNKNFIYHPKRISISEFIRFTSDYLRNNDYLRSISEQYNITSFYNEFRKGRNHINANYLRVKIEVVEENLILELADIWNQFKEDIDSSELIYLNQFIVKCRKYSEINDRLNTREIFYLLKEEILSKKWYNINSIKTLNGNYFWDKVLPEVIVMFRIYPDKSYLRQME